MTNVLTTSLEFADVASAYRGMLDGSFQGSRRQAAAIGAGVSIWRDNPGFSNATEEQMADWLANGYKVAGEKIAGSNTRNRRKLRFVEDDGEFQIDRALAGDDAIYLNRTPRKRQRGITIEVEIGFRASVTGSTLDAYARWLGKLITGLEGGGFQTRIEIVTRSPALDQRAMSTRVDANMRVKDFGQRGSLKSWSALLSPGGHRHLIFAARILACEKLGFGCHPGFGGSVHPAWGVRWDAEKRKLTIGCHSTAESFPTEQMDRQLAAIKF